MNIAIDFKKRELPLLPLRGLSVFPGMLLNLDVERAVSIAALNKAMNDDQIIFLSAQKELSKEAPTEKDLYRIGTVCKIRQLLRQPGGKLIRLMVEGLARGKISSFNFTDGMISAEIELLPDIEEVYNAKIETLRRKSVMLFAEYASESGNLAKETVANIMDNDNIAYVADYISQNIYLRPAQKQELLEERRASNRLIKLCELLEQEINYLQIERDLNISTNKQMSKSQKEYFLREQMKVIQSELGEDDSFQEIEEYTNKILALGLPEESEQKLLKETRRLSKQPFGSAEASVIRNYLDICLEVPWNKLSKTKIDLEKTAKVLDEEHFGLNKIKERILEYFAVRMLNENAGSDILCLVGPPGTGKTSVALSVAKASGRELSRVALGGVHDEAEIRGHRKTYIGAMPGRIVSGLIQAKSMNPVMVLDEIDKLGSDYKGDPASALLEALDSKLNISFRDNFLEIPLDLSDVLFITTANTTGTIPRPLLDRMEVIELTSYTDEEKLQIAKKHLLPKQRKKHGLNGNMLRISDLAIKAIISDYTRESGVRSLERTLAAICRKCASAIAKEEIKSMYVKPENLLELLGAPKYKNLSSDKKDEIGLVNGLAWTESGGDVLSVEAQIMPGTGKVELTGNLGDVMKESCKTALSYIRSRADRLGIDPMFYKELDLHVHFPEGAIPKDGPSAGLAICTALISALTKKAVRHDIAMTGEISLRGKALAIGGLKEKTMAALRYGVKSVIIPKANESDLEEIDQMVRAKLEFIFIEHMDELLPLAFADDVWFEE